MNDELRFSITESELKEIKNHINKALDSKISYDKDKLKMAEDTIDNMRTSVRLAKNALARITDSCCP